MKLCLLTLILVAWISNVTGSIYKFNCNLQTADPKCKGGTCNADGSCTCTGTAAGMICDKDSGDEGVNDCTLSSCQNGGTCYDSTAGDSTVQCECPESYAGDTCDKLRVDAICNDNGAGTQISVTLNIFPYDYFDSNGGKIYAKGKPAVTECRATDDVTDATMDTLTVPHTSADCADAVEPSPGVFTRCMYIVNSANGIYPDFDYQICATCPHFGDSLTKAASLSITEISTNINNIELSVAHDADVDLVLSTQSVVIANRGNVAFGATIVATFTLLQSGIDKGFKSLYVTECTVASMNLMTSGCPASNFDVWIGLESAVTSLTKKTMTFKAFVMQTPPEELHLACVLRLCKLEADCDPEDCSGAVGIGRKKRQVTAGETEEKRLAQTIRVVDRYDAAQQTNSGDKEEKACYMNWQMTATIVALSVGLLVVLLLCVILVVKAILNRRGAKTVYRDDSITTSAASTPQLPVIVSNKC